MKELKLFLTGPKTKLLFWNCEGRHWRRKTVWLWFFRIESSHGQGSKNSRRKLGNVFLWFLWYFLIKNHQANKPTKQTKNRKSLLFWKDYLVTNSHYCNCPEAKGHQCSIYTHERPGNPWYRIQCHWQPARG